MTRETKAKKIDRLLKQGRSNQEIVELLDLGTSDNLFKIVKRAKKRIEVTTVRRRLVDREQEPQAAKEPASV